MGCVAHLSVAVDAPSSARCALVRTVALADRVCVRVQEVTTPSRCGRMDQCCAFGSRVVAMSFDGDLMDTKPLVVTTPLNLVRFWLHPNQLHRRCRACYQSRTCFQQIVERACVACILLGQLLVDLGGKKDTTIILKELSKAFPFPSTDQEVGSCCTCVLPG